MSAIISRRGFLKAGSGLAVGHMMLGSVGAAAPSERVRLGFIGCGGRALQLMPMFLSSPDVEIPVICDVLEPRMERAAQRLRRHERPQNPDLVVDYRRILDRPDIDAVVIATTQHWHGLPHIHACEAGKPVFVEKPLSHTVVEGRRMVEAAKHYGVLAMMGTQQRAGDHYQKAVAMIRRGDLGRIGLVECWNYHDTGNRVGRPADTEVPPGYHWDRWLGPAPRVPFNPARLDSSWWFAYGGGMLTNWAVHHIDIILWAMAEEHPSTVVCSGGKFIVDDLADTPDTIEASWEFSSWLLQYRYRGFNNFHTVARRPHHHGICFHGHKATMVLDRYGYSLWKKGEMNEPMESMDAFPYFDHRNPLRSEQDGRWQRRFVECVKSNQSTPVDLEQSHRATVCCHLANVSYLSGRKIKWDAPSETIPNDPVSNQLLDRPRRQPYALPEIS